MRYFIGRCVIFGASLFLPPIIIAYVIRGPDGGNSIILWHQRCPPGRDGMIHRCIAVSQYAKWWYWYRYNFKCIDASCIAMHRNNRWIHLNNMTYILIVLKVQVRLKGRKLACFVKKITFLHYLRNAIYRHIVIFLGQCIDTLKSCIVPSLPPGWKCWRRPMGPNCHAIVYILHNLGVFACDILPMSYSVEALTASVAVREWEPARLAPPTLSPWWLIHNVFGRNTILSSIIVK